MKRPRSVSAKGAPTAKKKAKKMTKQEVVAVAVGGERLDYTALAAMDMALLEWEEWCSCSSSAWIMSWGTCWCPLWDVELMANAAAYEDLYNDVVWDYDIWDLKLINHIPN